MLSLGTLRLAGTWQDPTNGTPNSGLQDSYGGDYRAQRWIQLLDPPRALGGIQITSTLGPKVYEPCSRLLGGSYRLLKGFYRAT